MRYQIIDMDAVVVDVTNSYAQAIVWARVGEYVVLDTKQMKIIYDGQLDERL